MTLKAMNLSSFYGEHLAFNKNSQDILQGKLKRQQVLKPESDMEGMLLSQV